MYTLLGQLRIRENGGANVYRPNFDTRRQVFAAMVNWCVLQQNGQNCGISNDLLRGRGASALKDDRHCGTAAHRAGVHAQLLGNADLRNFLVSNINICRIQ
jgi:hypothetical protein